MFGFFIGGASLVGLIWVLRGGRHGHHHGHHHGRHHHRRGGFRGRWMNAIFERLDTSPGQEKAIRAALDEIMARGRELRDDTHALRRAAADTLKNPVFDASALDDGLARQTVAVAELQKALVAGLATLHETLDDDQRRRLADFAMRGPRHHRCGGSYRSWSERGESWA